MADAAVIATGGVVESVRDATGGVHATGGAQAASRGGTSQFTYRMVGLKTSNPQRYVYWDSPNSVDTNGILSGFFPDITDIGIAYIK